MQVDFNGNQMAFNLVRGNLRKEVASPPMEPAFLESTKNA